MDTPIVIVIVLLAFISLSGITSVIVISKRQEARKEVDPSRHRGAFQSQKDRVFKDGSTDHNDAPTSPS